MRGREFVAGLLVVLMAFPAWAGASENGIVGNVARSESTTLGGGALAPGSTILSGDTIDVNPTGAAWIALVGGSQIQIGEKSQVRLARSKAGVEFMLESGRAMFRSVEQAPVVAHLGDAMIQSAGGPASGLIEVRGRNEVFIAAFKGSLAIRTLHDNASLTLREGEGVTVPMAADPDPQGNRTRAAGYWSTGHILLLALGIGAAVGVTAGILATRGTSQSNPCLAVSPFTCF
jgi:hypothetical protein